MLIRLPFLRRRKVRPPSHPERFNNLAERLDALADEMSPAVQDALRDLFHEIHKGAK